MIHYLVKIVVHRKYWRDIPLLYSFAFILDPRAKMEGFTRVLRRLGSLTGTDYSTYLALELDLLMSTTSMRSLDLLG